MGDLDVDDRVILDNRKVGCGPVDWIGAMQRRTLGLYRNNEILDEMNTLYFSQKTVPLSYIVGVN